MPITVRGVQVVEWIPNYALTLVSDDGLSLPADGDLHRLTATLTNIATSQLVSGKQIRLSTVPLNRVGDLAQSTTKGGKAYFRVSDTFTEVVNYRAFLLPQQIVASGIVSISWTDGGTPPVPPVPPGWLPPIPPVPPSPPRPPLPVPPYSGTYGVGQQITPPIGSVAAGSPIVWRVQAGQTYGADFYPLPVGSGVQIFTDPPGGPSDGVTVAFADTEELGIFKSVANLTSTSAVPGSWTYHAISSGTLPMVLIPAPDPPIIGGADLVLTWT